MERTHVVVDQQHDVMMLPPGFRFHPTDEEIITHYLREKVMNIRFTAIAIGEVDLNRCEPWDLPKRAKMGENKEWFFFCQRDKKYPTGMRTNRATESGYWKATGKDKEIYEGKGNLIGMMKTLVFYKGRAPKGEKTNWVMHEYRLEGKFSYCNFPKSSRNDWVVCRIVHKNTTTLRKIQVTNLARKDTFVDHILDSPSLPALTDLPNTSNDTHGYSSFTNEEQEFRPPLIKPGDENFSFDNWIQMPQDNKFNINYHQASTSNSTPHSNFYPQVSHQHSSFNQESSSFQINSTQNNKYDGGMKQYYNSKVEQFSTNNSLVTVSQDTIVSTDVGPEISSVISMRANNDNNNNGDRSLEVLLNCF